MPRPAGLIDFTAERARHARFVGRTALLAQLDQLLIDEPADRWVVVTGGPGMGKSALLAQWLARCEAAGQAVPHHFIRRGEYDWDDPAKLVSSLVAQIVARFSDHPEPETDLRMHPAARLQSTLQRVSQHELVPRGERLVVLIDGLDEYDAPADGRRGAPGRDPLAEFLPHTLPSGVSLLCACRPRHPYVDMLLARSARQLDLDGAALAADNTATVQAFWDQAALELGLDAQFIAAAVDRAGGNPQHAEMLRKHLTGLPTELRHVEDIPAGLAGLLTRTWERMRADPAVVDGLGVLCAAREALTLDELQAVTGWAGETQRDAFKRTALEALIETRRAGRVSEYRLHHDSIRAYVANAVGTAALLRHHLALAQRLATWPAPADGHAVATFQGNTNGMNACAVTPDGRHVVSALDDRTLKVWELASGCAVATLQGHTGWVTGCAVAPDGRHVVSASSDHTLKVWKLASEGAVATPQSHTNWVRACAATANGRHVISASADHTLKVWELASGRAVATLQGHTNVVNACTVTLDGRHVVSASADHALKVWELASGRAVATLHGHTGEVRGCAVTPDGRHVVSASADHTLKVWELASERAVATLQGHTNWVNACAVTPDGRHVVSASSDQTLKIWELASGCAVATLEGHTLSVRACAVMPDGRHVVSASYDQTLKVWEIACGRAVATLQGHTDEVRACTVTLDGRHVVSASADRTLKIWELASHVCRITHRGDAGYAAVAVGATTVVAGDAAGGVWFLDMPPWIASPVPQTQPSVQRRRRWRRPR